MKRQSENILTAFFNMNKEPKIEDYKNIQDWGKAWVYFHFSEIKKRREQEERDQSEAMEKKLKPCYKKGKIEYKFKKS